MGVCPQCLALIAITWVDLCVVIVIVIVLKGIMEVLESFAKAGPIEHTTG